MKKMFIAAFAVAALFTACKKDNGAGTTPGTTTTTETSTETETTTTTTEPAGGTTYGGDAYGGAGGM